MMKREIQNVIITGPTGVMGIAIIKMCIARNIGVLAICRKGSPRLSALPKGKSVTIIEADMDDYEYLKLPKDRKYDACFHLAWEGTFGEKRNDMQVQVKNIQNTLHALKLAYAAGCKVFVGAGSQAEYGRKNERITPLLSTNPETGYGIAKLCAGYMTRLESKKKGIDHIWMRVLSVFGPGDGENTLIESTISKLINQERVPLTAGEQIWDYIYSSDAAEAFLLAAEYGVSGKVYCLGSGKARQLKDYVKSIKNMIGGNGQLGFGDIPYSENQVMCLYADISELEKDTGFRTKVPFEEGIKEILELKRNIP